MKYFKHKCDALDGEFVGELLARFGHLGYVVWFGGVLELLGVEFDDIMSDFRAGKTSNVRPVLSKSVQFLSKRVQSVPNRVLKVLRYCHKSGRIASLTYNHKTKSVEMFVPKFLDAMDEYTRKAISEICTARGLDPEKVRRDSGDVSGESPLPLPSPSLTSLPTPATAENRRGRRGGGSRSDRKNNADLILEAAHEGDAREAEHGQQGGRCEVDAPDRQPVPNES